MMGIGPAELTIMLMFLGGFGLPLGVPPQPEHPAMHYVAPPECVLYASWAGMATPDGTSANQTEQLFAEPELQEFAKSLEKSLGKFGEHFARQSDDPKAALMAQVAPQWTKTIITRPAAVFATKLELRGQQLLFEGGVLVDAGDQAGTLADGLVKLMSSEGNPPQAVTMGAAKFMRFAPHKDGPLAAEVMIGAAGPYVLVGFGADAVSGMMDRVRAKQVPAWLTEIGKRLPVERRSSISYVNTQKLVKAFLPLSGPDGARIASSLGLDQVGEVISVTGLEGDGMVSRGLLKIDGDAKGLLSLVDTKGIQPAQIGFLPKDATFATAFSFNTEQVFNLVAQLMAENAPDGVQGVEEMKAEFQRTFGIRLQEDLLASLGEVWTLSAGSADGWLGMTATVEVRDRTKLEAVLKRLYGMLSDAPPGRAPQIESTQFQGQTIQMLAMPGVPIRPAWCLADNRLIIAIAPQAIKAQLGAKAEETGLFASPALASTFSREGRVLAVSYQDSAKVFETTYSYLTLLAPMMLEGMNGGARSPDEPPMPMPFDLGALPSSRAIHRHLRPSVSFTFRTRDGVETESRQTFPTLNVGTAGPVAVALLLPAVQAARTAARRTQSANNLKHQLLAMHNYHDTFVALPAGYSTDKDGKPLLSWRVHILPFIEERQLYDQFKLDEPWDSPNNKPLIAKMPQVYRSPQSSAPPGMTTYLGIGGARGLLTKPDRGGGPAGVNNRGLSFAAVTDGTSNTLMIVEASDEMAVEWTKPEEFIPDAKNPLSGLLGMYPNGFNAGFADGSVRFISQSVDAKTLLHLFERNDGNVINLP